MTHEIELDYIVVTYMQTPGRWFVTLHLVNGETFSSVIRDGGSWEEYTKRYFPGVEVRTYDWRSKSWRDAIEMA